MSHKICNFSCTPLYIISLSSKTQPRRRNEKVAPRPVPRLNSTCNKITHLPYLMDKNKKLIPKNGLNVVFSLCESDYPGD